jgi:hypothetical protein
MNGLVNGLEDELKDELMNGLELEPLAMGGVLTSSGSAKLVLSSRLTESKME